MCAHQKVCQKTPGTLSVCFSAAVCVLGEPSAGFKPDRIVESEIQRDARLLKEVVDERLCCFWIGKKLCINNETRIAPACFASLRRLAMPPAPGSFDHNAERMFVSIDIFIRPDRLRATRLPTC